MKEREQMLGICLLCVCGISVGAQQAEEQIQKIKRGEEDIFAACSMFHLLSILENFQTTPTQC